MALPVISAAIALAAVACFIASAKDLDLALPASPVVTDRNGGILLARVASDDQWRFPVTLREMSPWLVQATIAVEDQRFASHPGVDPIAIARAVGQNLAAGHVVSGASTLTMQLCRLLDPEPRTWGAKFAQACRALQLAHTIDTSHQIELYLNLAPYGGNLCGVEAASRAYLNKHAADLSLGEAALLAGLPQAPSRLRPDRHPGAARTRRTTVLRRMLALGMISQSQRDQADAEPVTSARHSWPHLATDAAWMALAQRPAGGRTTIDRNLQSRIERLAAEHVRTMPEGSSVAVVAMDIARGDIIALVGGASNASVHRSVNTALAHRSPGSALKPFVYAAAFEAGRLAPDSIVYDIPIERTGWSPRNFDREFLGPIHAAEALRRSRNVPAILVTEGICLPRVLGVIEAVGIPLPPGVDSRVGLGAVVGGIEVTLIDLVNAYATLGRGGLRLEPRLFVDEPRESVRVLSHRTCATIDDVLSSHRRVPHGMETLAPGCIPSFMWKTGTSSGRRDAWAVGHNGRYAIGVWAGSASGAGNSQYVGAEAAEPLLAELFNLPELRRTAPPESPPPLAVTKPLAPPPDWAGPLRIVSPSDGAEFLTVGDEAIVHVRANRAAELTWFVDGRVIDTSAAPRLRLHPGAHEIRCTGADSTSHAIRVIVRSAPAVATRDR